MGGGGIQHTYFAQLWGNICTCSVFNEEEGAPIKGPTRDKGDFWMDSAKRAEFRVFSKYSIGLNLLVSLEC